MEFLEKVNEDLKESVSIASRDYVLVSYLLKNYYKLRNQLNPQPVLTEYQSKKLQELTSSLQYMDVFSQRVYHLILTHQRMAHQNFTGGLAESFFHLHIFQAMTIEMDVVRSINHVKTTLEEIKTHFLEVGKIDWMEEDLFENTHLIKEKLQKTISDLRNVAGEKELLQLPTLLPEQLKVLNMLYSMENERVVLNWFLSNMPNGTWEELVQHYEKQINKLDDVDIELF